MIVGVDHIAFTPSNFSRVRKELLAIGYLEVYCESVDNPVEKNIYQSCVNNIHKISYLQHDSNLPIELNTYPNTSNRETNRLCPTFSTSEIQEVGPRLIGGEMRACFSTGQKRSLTIYVKQPLQSVQPWLNLGLQTSTSTEELITLKYSSPIEKKSFTIHLAQSNKVQYGGTLDSLGFSCIGLLVTNLERTILSVEEYVESRSPPFSLNVNGNNMNIQFIRLDDGIIIELITF